MLPHPLSSSKNIFNTLKGNLYQWSNFKGYCEDEAVMAAWGRNQSPQAHLNPSKKAIKCTKIIAVFFSRWTDLFPCWPDITMLYIHKRLLCFLFPIWGLSFSVTGIYNSLAPLLKSSIKSPSRTKVGASLRNLRNSKSPINVNRWRGTERRDGRRNQRPPPNQSPNCKASQVTLRIFALRLKAVKTFCGTNRHKLLFF